MALAVFVYGALRHPPLLRIVLGRDAILEPAVLRGHAVHGAQDVFHPVLAVVPGASAEGSLLREVSEDDAARLAFYGSAMRCRTAQVSVETAAGVVKAQVSLLPGEGAAGAAWDYAAWGEGHGPVVTAAAGDVMAMYGERAVPDRYTAMLVRGAGRVRADATFPTTVRRVAVPADVDVARRAHPYAAYFSVEEYDLRFRRFDGAMSPEIDRAAFVSGDAVTVLPYDPVRDRVLLIEQFRMGPFARGDSQPWMLEPIAGRIDPGETPEHAARREAVEEAGLVLGDLIRVAGYYPSPAAKTEFLYSYVALCDLPDDAAGVFGAEVEAEDIRGHLMGFDAFMALVASGEVAVGPLLITAFWLQRERALLREGADRG